MHFIVDAPLILICPWQEALRAMRKGEVDEVNELRDMVARIEAQEPRRLVTDAEVADITGLLGDWTLKPQI